MFAVIRTGGKQYCVAPNDVIQIERIAGQPGEIVELGEVMLLGGGDGGPQTGKPLIKGALVAAEVLEQVRGEKIRVFKKIRRKNHRRTHGHRQLLTKIRITEILTDGKKPSKAARAEPAKAKKAPVAGEASEPKPQAAKSAKPAKRAAVKAEAKKPARAKPEKSKAKAPSRAKPKK